MTQLMQHVMQVILTGCGATVVMDLWLMFLKRQGIQTLNFAFIGRWVGHLFRGKFVHKSIGKAPPIYRELQLGWFAHYVTGVAFASLLAISQGNTWFDKPSLMPALMLGIGTVTIPLFVMQPAMGLGVASSRTATPFANCVRSLANHTVFGLGLYLSAAAVAWSAR